MAFYSLSFILFLALLWGIARTASPGLRQWTLLAASYYFYWTWSGGFLLLLVLVSAFDYGWGHWLASRRKPGILWLGIAVNLSVLVSFKTGLLSTIGERWSLGGISLLPVGISFFTFQGIAFLIDVYRGYEVPASRPFFLYMAFWPTVLSGPICRAPELIPQLEAARHPGWDDFRVGVRRVVLGLFLKLVLAETLWVGVRPGQGIGNLGDVAGGPMSPLDWLLAALGFGLWLYFDFAGYTHIVCGAARLLGVRLRENFRFPYHALSLQEFWTRWHMSLSSWIRDYVFFPLSSFQRSPAWRYLALVFSMLLFGIWHGLGWNFAFWGLYHGALLALWRRFGPARGVAGAFQRGVCWLATILLACLGWLLFWADAQGTPLVLARGVDFQGGSSFPADLALLVLLLWGGHLALGWLIGDWTRWRPESWKMRAQELLSLPLTIVMLIVVVALTGGVSPFAYVSF